MCFCNLQVSGAYFDFSLYRSMFLKISENCAVYGSESLHEVIELDLIYSFGGIIQYLPCSKNLMKS